VPHDFSLLRRSARLEIKNQGFNPNSDSASNASLSAPSVKGKKNKGKSAITSMMEGTAYEGHSVPRAPPAPHLSVASVQAIGVAFARCRLHRCQGMFYRSLIMQETTSRTRCSREQLLVPIIKYLMVFSPRHSGLLMFKNYQSVWNLAYVLMVMSGSLLLMGVLQCTPYYLFNPMNEVMFELYLLSSTMCLVCLCVCRLSLF
jgi:hypothetical protein